jgi:NDP-sugar pyrophosphorylase family protein
VNAFLSAKGGGVVLFLGKKGFCVNTFSCEHFFDLAGFEHHALFEKCDFVWQALEKLNGYLAQCKLGNIEALHQECAYFVNPELISIGKGTIVEPGAYIKGPCIIGKNCHIRHGAYIRGEVVIGDGCVVGHTTELKHTIFLNHAAAAHFAYIGDSILGNNTNLGAGTKCANLRLDGGAVIVHNGHESLSTGMRKFGAIIGDGCQIGCNTVLNPGCVLGKNVHVYPSLNVGGYISSKSLVKPGTRPIIIAKK